MNTTARDNSAYVLFENVQKSYDGEVLVVKNLNLAISRGEFLTMLGPSGSGKTTCLMMLAGFETATHGNILLDGRRIDNVAPHKRGIGMVFQNYALFPHMSVAENLAFPLSVRKVSRAETESRVKRALNMVELDQLGDRMPAQLSGGQQQRVAVARALVFEPDLVLMDEPLGALDKNLREQMQYEIKHIHDQLGVTVVYVTHDQSEALTMSNRIAVFEDGVVQQLASPTDLYEHPSNAFVAAFIGESNRLLGTITATEGRTCEVRLDSGELIHATAVNIGGLGARSTLSLRPERVVILSGDARGGDSATPNVFDAEVQELIYLGDHIRTRVRVCGSDEFIVKVPNVGGERQLTVGRQVRIGWSVEDCHALDA
jgi:putative spermidine/putrescine transport system ATP-binding protein